MLPDVGEDLGVGERERMFIGALRVRREFWESDEGFGVDHTVNARKNPGNHVGTWYLSLFRPLYWQGV